MRVRLRGVATQEDTNADRRAEVEVGGPSRSNQQVAGLEPKASVSCADTAMEVSCLST